MTVTVFCGSASGASPRIRQEAVDLASELGAANCRLVYGGATVGLMGAVADAALAAGGEVVGVIPQGLVDREIAHQDLTQLHVVPDMHQRKALMAELSDAFIALPGGSGTLEELFEVWTWQQLGFHSKPVAVLNVDGFWDPLLSMIDHMVTTGFVKPACRDSLVVVDKSTDVLPALQAWSPHTSPAS